MGGVQADGREVGNKVPRFRNAPDSELRRQAGTCRVGIVSRQTSELTGHFRDREQSDHIRGGGKTSKKIAVEGTATTLRPMKRGLQILGAVAVLGLGAFLAMRAWRAGEDPTKVTGDAKHSPEQK